MVKGSRQGARRRTHRWSDARLAHHVVADMAGAVPFMLPAMAREQFLYRHFVSLADTLASDWDIGDFSELGQLKPDVPVRSQHHGDLDSDIVEADDIVHSMSLDGRLTFHLQSDLHEERGSCREVDDDSDVVHPLDRHGASNGSSA